MLSVNRLMVERKFPRPWDSSGLPSASDEKITVSPHARAVDRISATSSLTALDQVSTSPSCISRATLWERVIRSDQNAASFTCFPGVGRKDVSSGGGLRSG